MDPRIAFCEVDLRLFDILVNVSRRPRIEQSTIGLSAFRTDLSKLIGCSWHYELSPYNRSAENLSVIIKLTQSRFELFSF